MVADSNEFVKWLPNVKGKFVLISAAYPTCRPEDEWAAMATPESKARMDTTIVKLVADWSTRIRNTGYPVTAGNPTGNLGMRLEKAGAAGVIVSNLASPTGGAWGTWTVYDTKNKTALGIAMSCEDYGLLYRLTERKQGPQLRVNATRESLGAVPVFNTFGTIKGTEKPNEIRAALGALRFVGRLAGRDGQRHRHDHDDGGDAHSEDRRIRIRSARSWSATGRVKSRASSARARSRSTTRSSFARFRRGFNQDNGTGRIVSTSGVGLPDGGAHMQAWLAKLPQEFQDQLKYNGVGAPATGGTDNASFDCYGAPVFGLERARTGTTARTRTTPIATASTRSCSTISRGTRRSSRCSRISRPRIRRSISRERADLTAAAAAAVAVRGGRGAPSGRGAINLGGGGRGAAAAVAAVRSSTRRVGRTTCPKAPRFFNDTSRVTAPSKRP